MEKNYDVLVVGGGMAGLCAAISSARVMGTCAVGGQAVGIAAAMAAAGDLLPGEIDVGTLQQKLLSQGCYLPGIPNCDKADLARNGTVTASSWLREARPEEVINGWNRTIKGKGNFWQPKVEDQPWLQITLAAPARVKEVQLLFDSNLCREIMITLSASHRADQEPGTPSELVKDFRLTFFRDGQEAGQCPVVGNYQRRCVVRMEEPVFCDSIRLTIEKTHGVSAPKVYEVRVYAAECR